MVGITDESAIERVKWAKQTQQLVKATLKKEHIFLDIEEDYAVFKELLKIGFI